MPARIETIVADRPSAVEWAARRAAEVLAAGGLVVHPTETVYGLGGDGSEASNARIARIKGREAGKPLILLTPDVSALKARFPGIVWTAEAVQLAARFWPGPLTLVVPGGDAPRGLLGPSGGLAVRMSPDPIIRALLERWGRPMTSTSANRSGEPAPRNLDEAAAVLRAGAELGGDLLAIDGGPREEGRASTIVSLLGTRPILLREGPIGPEVLATVIDNLERGFGADE